MTSSGELGLVASVRHQDAAQAGAGERRLPSTTRDDPLSLKAKACPWLHLALVIDLGGKPGYVRVQPVRVREKQAPVGRHRLFTVQQVIESGHFAAFGVAALQRLFELLGIAKQDEASAAARAAEHVGQRHLASFVDHQDIHALLEFGPCPAPCRRAQQVDFVLCKLLANPRVGIDAFDTEVALVLAPLAVDDPYRKPTSRGPFSRGLKEIDDHLVAHGRHADPEPLLDERADDLAARIGLASTGRTLNGEHLAVERERDSSGGLNGVLPSERERADGRRTPQQKVDCRAIRLPKCESVLEHGPAEVLQRVSK